MGIVSSSKCDSCPGISDRECNKYCDARVGQNIVNFVNSLDKIKVSIGDFVMEKDGTYKYAVTGIILENSTFDSPTNLLSDISKLKMAKSDKLRGSLDLTSQQALLAYTKSQNLGQEVTQKALDDLKLFNSKKIIPVVIKPDTEIEIEIIGIDDKPKRLSTYVLFSSWELSEESGELEGYLVVKLKKDQLGISENKFMLTDYGKTWRIPNFEVNLKTTEIRYDIVKRNALGLINPLEVQHGQYRIVVDCSYMYCIVNGSIHIIGIWGSNGMVENRELVKTLKNTKAYKQIKSYLPFLSIHRRFIMPFGMAETNKVLDD